MMTEESIHADSEEQSTGAESAEEQDLASQGESEETEIQSDDEESNEGGDETDESQDEDESENEEGDESESDEDEDSESEEDGEGEKNEPRKKPRGAQKRIQKLVSKLSAKDQRILELESEIAARDAGKGGKSADNSLVLPKEEDFNTVEDFEQAMFEYRLAKRDQETKAKADARDLAAKQAEAKKKLDKRVAEFKKTHGDYDEVIASAKDFELPGWLNYEIFHSDLGPELAYELARDPDTLDKLEELAKSNQGAAVRLLGKFETKIEAKKAEASAKQAATKTTNQKPIAPVHAKGNGIKKSIYDKDISFTDYERLRLAEMKR